MGEKAEEQRMIEGRRLGHDGPSTTGGDGLQAESGRFPSARSEFRAPDSTSGGTCRVWISCVTVREEEMVAFYGGVRIDFPGPEYLRFASSSSSNTVQCKKRSLDRISSIGAAKDGSWVSLCRSWSITTNCVRS